MKSAPYGKANAFVQKLKRWPLCICCTHIIPLPSQSHSSKLSHPLLFISQTSLQSTVKRLPWAWLCTAAPIDCTNTGNRWLRTNSEQCSTWGYWCHPVVLVPKEDSIFPFLHRLHILETKCGTFDAYHNRCCTQMNSLNPFNTQSLLVKIFYSICVPPIITHFFLDFSKPQPCVNIQRASRWAGLVPNPK